MVLGWRGRGASGFFNWRTGVAGVAGAGYVSPKAGDYARAQASVRRAACGACRAAGGDVRRAVPARLVALRAAAEWRKIQEQADGVRTASEYDESRRPAWSARANVDGLRDAAAFRGVAAVDGAGGGGREALTTLHGEQLCSRVHTVSLRSSAPVRLVRHAQAISAPSCSFSTFPSCSRKIVPSSSTLAPPCPLQGSSCLPVPHR